MKTLLPILVLISAGACCAQTGVTSCGTDKNGRPDCGPVAPITCSGDNNCPPVTLLGPKIQPPDKPCDPKYEYEGMTMPDKPGFAGKVLCAPIMHTLTEREWQALMERLKKLEAK